MAHAGAPVLLSSPLSLLLDPSVVSPGVSVVVLAVPLALIEPVVVVPGTVVALVELGEPTSPLLLLSSPSEPVPKPGVHASVTIARAVDELRSSWTMTAGYQPGLRSRPDRCTERIVSAPRRRPPMSRSTAAKPRETAPSPARDPVAPWCADVLGLFVGPLQEVRFPDVDGTILEQSAEAVRAGQLEIESLER